MGNGASAGIAAAASTASVDELKAALAGLPAEARKKLQDGLSANADQLNILLQEDLLIRGGAQLWLMNCGSRLREAGHQVTFLLPDKSLIVDDCKAIPGAKVATYDADAIAESPETFTEQFTELLKPADVCVTLVRQKRGGFQNVGYMGECIQAAKLKTFLIAKTGTPDPSYEPSFYGGPLLATGQCCVITIAKYTKDFIVENMGVPAELITNVYNGTGACESEVICFCTARRPRLRTCTAGAPTGYQHAPPVVPARIDTAKFRRTPEMAAEALKRYPCATPENAFVVGCIGSYEERKAQSLLLKAAKKLIDDKKLPNIHCLLVGEGPDKDMLTKLIDELGAFAAGSLVRPSLVPLSLAMRVYACLCVLMRVYACAGRVYVHAHARCHPHNGIGCTLRCRRDQGPRQLV
mmetsp:Transcript_17872/g.53402  ORF Transcript_17872/g.53402 Transcript_17872/m.53402 type:complete len:409 (+) Transcript_17872:98-1324(+)